MCRMRVLQMSALVACALGACGETVRISPVVRNPTVPPPDVPTTAAQLAFATSDDSDFVKLGPPRPGEWLAEHPESGQTFDGMNGSNSLAESDRRPIHLCPVCLRKLQWNRGFDVLARYRALAAFYDRQGLADEAAWVRNRVAGVSRR